MDSFSTTLALITTFAGAIGCVVIWRADRERRYLVLGLFFTVLFVAEALETFAAPTGRVMTDMLDVLKFASLVAWLVLELRARRQRIQQRLTTR
jgi:hypothetical protein